MPTIQDQCLQAIFQAITTAFSLAALYHLVASLTTHQPDYQDLELDDQDNNQEDQPPPYEAPVLRTRPLVPAIDLSVYTYM